MNRTATEWALVIALSVIAVAYFMKPARADDLPIWSAELWVTERGEELVATVTSGPEDDSGDTLPPSLVVMCGDDLWLRYDPGSATVSEEEWLNESGSFSFDFGAQKVGRDLVFEAMDAMFATELGRADPLLEAIRTGDTVTVAEANLPANTFSLKGSTAAIDEVLRSCG